MTLAAVLVAAHAGAISTVRGAVERLLAPLLCRLFGYMPGRRLGLGEDLKAGFTEAELAVRWLEQTATLAGDQSLTGTV